MRRALTAAAAALGLVLLLPHAALADEYDMRINEVAPYEGWVELLILNPQSTQFGDPEGYVVRSYDGALNEVDARVYPPPLPFPNATPYVVELELSTAGGGQVCFERNVEPTFLPEDYRLHCLGYGEVTRPAVRRMQVYGPRRIAMPVAPMPGPGESAQRQPCGRAGTAPSTRGAANAVVRGACAGLANCDDPANYDNTEPRLRVELNRVHDIDRPFFLSVTSNEPGDFRGLGSYGWSSRGGVRFRLDAVLRANVTTRIRIPIGAKAKRMIRRAARRGVETRGGYRAVGRDDACYPNRSHSSRFFTLVP